MSRERERDREIDLRDDDRVEHHAPGRIATSAKLESPSRPVASGLVTRKTRPGPGPSEDAESAVAAASASSAHGLPDELRSRFESSLGADLSEVRIHTGPESADAADAVSAHAFALGNDIHFAAGAYDPSSSTGAHLIAHEVAHTVQQRGGAPVRQFKLEVSSAGDALEIEADAAAAAMVSGTSFQLSAAGNGTALRLQRDEDKTKAADKSAEKAKMDAVESRMTTVANSAQTVGGAILADSDACIAAIKSACDHLKKSAANYSAAYQKVKAKLAEAQKRYELEQAVTSAVKDLVVGSTIGLLPGLNSSLVLAMTAVKNSKGEIVSSLGSIGAGIVTNAVNVADGAVKKATAEGPAPAAPKDSISGVGLTPADKVCEAFSQLTAMVDALPAMGSLGGAIKDIAISASNIGKEAVKAGSGGKAKWSPEEIQSKADAIETLEKTKRADARWSSSMRQKLQGMESGITNVEILDVDTLENKLWTNWLASRNTRPEKDLIDNDVLEDYLVQRGIMKSPGKYMSDQDEDDAVVEAQKKVLKDHHVEAPSDPAKVASLYRREMKCDEMKRALIGKEGVIETENRVQIDGQTYRAPGNMGAEVGGRVKVLWVVARPERQSPDLNIVEWMTEDFDVLGDKV